MMLWSSPPRPCGANQNAAPRPRPRPTRPSPSHHSYPQLRGATYNLRIRVLAFHDVHDGLRGAPGGPVG
eukprot:7553409-Pyramimonas_sp.AAC.1